LPGTITLPVTIPLAGGPVFVLEDAAL